GRDRGLDALLVLAVAELDERVLVEPEPGDVPPRRRVHERLRARAELAPLREADEGVALGLPVEAVFGLPVEAGLEVIREEVKDEPSAQLARLQAHLLLLVLVD